MHPPPSPATRGSGQGPELPAPGPAALAHSERLVAAIRREMEAAGGLLPFDRYMDLALYAPGLGYYVAGSHKFGAEGDFVTAPEVSPLFGRCLARQCAEVLQLLRGGDILELGAGSGSLAAVMLGELEDLDALPDRYLILEPSPELRQRQAILLHGMDPSLASRVQWLDRLPRGIRGVALANEVLDAMPVQRFTVRRGAVAEIFVGWSDDGFGERVGPPASPGLEAQVGRLLDAGLSMGEGYTSEINLRAGPWVNALAAAMQAGVVLLIDYGYPRREYYLPERCMGTLMCHYRHRAHPDPYRLVGLQDITAYVDFSAVAEAGLAAGMSLAGYTSQANFLLGLGLDGMLAQSDPEDLEAHLRLVQGAKRLVLPSEMGERFQVLALARGVPEILRGFSLRDLRARL